MKIAVIDDEKPARDELQAIIHDYNDTIEVYSMPTANSAIELLSKDQSISLVFIDINMPDINGITLATMLHRLNPGLGIVFATAYNNYAKEAFEVEAFGYILKPYDDAKIMEVIEKFQTKLQHEKLLIDAEKRQQYNPIKVRNGMINNEMEDQKKSSAQQYYQHNSQRMMMKLPIMMQKKTFILDVRDIVYAEIEHRTCVIHTVKGDYSCNYTMSVLEEKLKDYDFFRIQKSYLINLSYLLEIYPWFNNTNCVKMKGYENEILTVGRTQVKELKSMLNL